MRQAAARTLPLPLFEDKREVELVWNGKSREVCTAILPFLKSKSFVTNLAGNQS